MVGRTLVTPNMVSWNLDTLENDHSEGPWNLVTLTCLYLTLEIQHCEHGCLEPGYSEHGCLEPTPNMVAWNLDTLEHDHSEITWNLVTPTWLYSTLVIATL